MKLKNLTKENKKINLPYSSVAKKSADAALKEINTAKQVLTLPNDLSVKVLIVLINAHLANLGKIYAQEVKKGLRVANLPEVVSNDVDSGAIFQVIPPQCPKVTPPTVDPIDTPLASQHSEDHPAVRPKIRHPSISTASTSSEQSHLQALETAISTIDTDTATQEEEIEIQCAVQAPAAEKRTKEKQTHY